MNITRIAANTRKKKVAAYARVSTNQESQEESFESQVRYFTEYIGSVDHWEFVRVYADDGISGVAAAKRPEFLQMIADAENGKIDLILVKSISRFARNAKEAQTYMHRLKERNVEIRFEREGISSMDPQAELVFNFLVIMAQEESRSISQNIQWSYKKRAQQGIRHVGSNHVLGYDEIDGELVPNEQAWIVKAIFGWYATGKSLQKIADKLEAEGVKTLRGKERFGSNTILLMLRNEVYKGDRLLQKKPHYNYMLHKPEEGTEYERYYVENDHEPIVSREVWEKVQQMLDTPKERKDYQYKNSHYLKGKVICGECGSEFVRVTRVNATGKHKNWICMDRRAGKHGNGCKCGILAEEELLEKIGEISPEELKQVTVFKDGKVEVVCE
jgi:DNA invertase Pin-like site-specific DNA recombinase